MLKRGRAIKTYAWLVVVVSIVGLSSSVAQAVPEREWGLTASTNFESLLPIGVLKELSAAPLLAGLGANLRVKWFWSLHVRPWAQVFFADDRNRMAGGVDLLWGNPRYEPNLGYVGFGLMVSDFLPRPITNFVIGYERQGEVCNLALETHLLFLTSLQFGINCGI